MQNMLKGQVANGPIHCISYNYQGPFQLGLGLRASRATSEPVIVCLMLFRGGDIREDMALISAPASAGVDRDCNAFT